VERRRRIIIGINSADVIEEKDGYLLEEEVGKFLFTGDSEVGSF